MPFSPEKYHTISVIMVGVSAHPESQTAFVESLTDAEIAYLITPREEKAPGTSPPTDLHYLFSSGISKEAMEALLKRIRALEFKPEREGEKILDKIALLAYPNAGENLVYLFCCKLFSSNALSEFFSLLNDSVFNESVKQSPTVLFKIMWHSNDFKILLLEHLRDDVLNEAILQSAQDYRLNAFASMCRYCEPAVFLPVIKRLTDKTLNTMYLLESRDNTGVRPFSIAAERPQIFQALLNALSDDTLNRLTSSSLDYPDYPLYSILYYQPLPTIMSIIDRVSPFNFIGEDDGHAEHRDKMIQDNRSLKKEEKDAIKKQLADARLFMTHPVESVQKRAQEFVKFLSPYIKNENVIFRFPEWVKLLETALGACKKNKNPASDSVCMLLVRTHLAHHHKKGDDVSLGNAYLTLTRLTGFKHLNQEDNALAGQLMTEFGSPPLAPEEFILPPYAVQLACVDYNCLYRNGLLHLQEARDPLLGNRLSNNLGLPVQLPVQSAGPGPSGPETKEAKKEKSPMDLKLEALATRIQYLGSLKWGLFSEQMDKIQGKSEWFLLGEGIIPIIARTKLICEMGSLDPREIQRALGDLQTAIEGVSRKNLHSAGMFPKKDPYLTWLAEMQQVISKIQHNLTVVPRPG